MPVAATNSAMAGLSAGSYQHYTDTRTPGARAARCAAEAVLHSSLVADTCHLFSSPKDVKHERPRVSNLGRAKTTGGPFSRWPKPDITRFTVVAFWTSEIQLLEFNEGDKGLKYFREKNACQG